MKKAYQAVARFRPLQMAAVSVLFAAVALVCMKFKLFVLGADIGWHLKVGEYIVRHRTFPHTGILSRTAVNRSWAAYSWGYEVLLSRFYAWWGLVGIGIFGTVLTLMVAFSIYWMTRRLSARFWRTWLLTAVGCYTSLLLKMVPRPLFFSMALYCVVLLFVLEDNRRGKVQKLYWLPLVFLLWANLHIQFVYGLAIVGLLLAVVAAQELAQRSGIVPGFLTPASLPAGQIAVVFAACVLATMIGPYTYHLYGVIFQYSQAQVPYAMVQELQRPSFRTYGDFARLLLAALAFYAVASQKKIDLFKLMLLMVTSFIGFRTMRDAWFQCIAAIACLADASFSEARSESPETPLQWGSVVAAVVLVVTVFAGSVGFSRSGIEGAMSGMFPVRAARFLQEHPQRGPLWNPFDWGGYLIWALPEYPVAIDGRTDLYGDRLEQLFHDTESGETDYRSDPYFSDAGVAMLRTRMNLAYILEDDPRYQKVYQDEVASVYVKR